LLDDGFLRTIVRALKYKMETTKGDSLESIISILKHLMLGHDGRFHQAFYGFDITGKTEDDICKVAIGINQAGDGHHGKGKTD
jgi:hypothetical protein